MNSITANLLDPSWWFTGIFFVLVAFALPPILRLLRKSLRTLARGYLARSRLKVKNTRLNDPLITYAIGKANAHYVLFMALAVGYLFFLFLLSAPFGGKIPTAVAAILATPVFIFELAWIASDSFVKEILKSRSQFLRGKKYTLNA